MLDENPFKNSIACWIWPKAYHEPNQYIQFRHEFTIHEKCSDAVFQVSADSIYAFWINGSFVHSGQFHDWPGQKTFDTLQISDYLIQGKNVICIAAYYQGINSAQYVKAEPGIIYDLMIDGQNITSGTNVIYRPSPAYKVTQLPRITPQLHFTFEFDSRLDDPWLTLDYVPDKSWHSITDKDIDLSAPSLSFIARSVKKVCIGGRLPIAIVAQGYFKRSDKPTNTLAQSMYYDFLSTRLPNEIFETDVLNFLTGVPANIKAACDGADGIYLVLDLGAEQVGFFELDIDTDNGSVVDIAYGEHLDDLRVRASIGSRNFANRYIATGLRQSFTHFFTRFAARYIQLHISNFKSTCILHYAGLRNVEYPIQIRGSFESSCALHKKIYDTAVRTLHLSMHEHYEDCPWREQALYSNDARNQALSGYYCFGEHEFPAASFELLGRGLKPDGYLELCAPAELPITIPSFSMAWILAVADHLLYSGNIKFSERMYPIVRSMLNSWCLSLHDGLLPCPQGQRYWHFYDWASGLDGTVEGDCTCFEELSAMRYDAPLNLLLCMALDCAAMIAEHCDASADAAQFKSQAQLIKSKIHTKFFDASSGLYVTYSGGNNRRNHYAQLTQSLALLAGVCSSEQADIIRRELVKNNAGLVETTLSQSLYKFQALLTDKTRYGKYVFDNISSDWGGMLFKGATSFWETLKGGWDFDLAGSLCHGWSAIPVYFYHAHLLGIRPVEPGFKKFTVDPVKGLCCAGMITTPNGNISTKITVAGDKTCCKVEYPSCLVPIITTEPEPKEMVFELEAV